MHFVTNSNGTRYFLRIFIQVPEVLYVVGMLSACDHHATLLCFSLAEVINLAETSLTPVAGWPIAARPGELMAVEWSGAEWSALPSVLSTC